MSNETRTKRILIVEDHPIFLLGMVELVESEGDLEVCAKADNASSAMAAMRTTNPDAVLLDITLPGINGIELIKMMKAEMPKLPILVLSVHRESHYALRALRAGSQGYIMKGEAAGEVLVGLRKILAGDVHLNREFSEQLIFKTIRSAAEDQKSPVSNLSPRELEVLELVGQGFGTREIGTRLNLSVKTVESHRGHIREKMLFRDSAELTRFAVDWMAHQDET